MGFFKKVFKSAGDAVAKVAKDTGDSVGDFTRNAGNVVADFGKNTGDVVNDFGKNTGDAGVGFLRSDTGAWIAPYFTASAALLGDKESAAALADTWGKAASPWVSSFLGPQVGGAFDALVSQFSTPPSLFEQQQAEGGGSSGGGVAYQAPQASSARSMSWLIPVGVLIVIGGLVWLLTRKR